MSKTTTVLLCVLRVFVPLWFYPPYVFAFLGVLRASVVNICLLSYYCVYDALAAAPFPAGFLARRSRLLARLNR